MDGYQTSQRAHHNSNCYRTSLDGDRQTQIEDNAPTPAEQCARALDLPPGETLDVGSVRALAALFAALASDLRSRNPERLLTRRIVALGVQMGSIDCTLQDAGRALNVTRQAVLQTGQAALRKMALIFEADELTEHNKHVTGKRPKAQEGLSE